MKVTVEAVGLSPSCWKFNRPNNFTPAILRQSPARTTTRRFALSPERRPTSKLGANAATTRANDNGCLPCFPPQSNPFGVFGLLLRPISTRLPPSKSDSPHCPPHKTGPPPAPPLNATP